MGQWVQATKKERSCLMYFNVWLQLHQTSIFKDIFWVAREVIPQPLGFLSGFGLTLRASFRLLRVVVSRSWCYKNLHGRPWAQSDTSGIFGEIARPLGRPRWVSFGNPLHDAFGPQICGLPGMRKNPKCLLPTCCCTSLGTSKTQ